MKKRSRKQIWIAAAALALVVGVLPFIGLGGSADIEQSVYHTAHDASWFALPADSGSVELDGGSYYIEDDVSALDVYVVGGDVTVLCLNSHAPRSVTVTSGAHLALCDCVGDVEAYAAVTVEAGGLLERFDLRAEEPGLEVIDPEEEEIIMEEVVFENTAPEGFTDGYVVTDSHHYRFCTDPNQSTLNDNPSSGTAETNNYGSHADTEGGADGICDTCGYHGSGLNSHEGWTEWTGGSLSNGKYYLTSDVNVGTITISGRNVTLCLNGNSIIGNQSGSVIRLESDATLNLCDCSGGGGTITGGHMSQGDSDRKGGGGVYIYRSTLNMYGGSITGNKASADPAADEGYMYGQGGGVFIYYNSVFNMYGGSINNNIACGTDEGSGRAYGGGVALSDNYNNRFNMYGGSISNNKVKTDGTICHGGGVSNDEAVFNMYGGEISNNQVLPMNGEPFVWWYGGGVYNYGTFTMYAGTISDNSTSGGDGGGVATCSGSLFTMNGGEIRDNTAASDGGGVLVYNTDARFIMNGGTIKGNTASAYGGGVYSCYGASVTMTGSTIGGTGADDANTAKNGGGLYLDTPADIRNVSIIGNTATEHGGGACVTNTGISLNNCLVSENSAPNGGGISVRSIYSDLALTIAENTQITENEATEYGGGVCVLRGSASMTAGSIHQNTAPYGGGISVSRYTSSSVFKISGNSTIYENTATVSGGGVYVQSALKNDAAQPLFEMSESARIYNNTAATSGGGVYNSGKVTMTGGTIGGTETTDANTAPVGGGVFNQGVDLDGTSPEACTFSMSGNAKIIGNKATTGSGGGVYNAGVSDSSRSYGTFSMSENAEVKMNTSPISGGGVYNTGTVTMTGGTIGGTGVNDANTAPVGGGVYNAESGLINIAGNIIGNKATTGSGGGVYNTATVTMTGGQISANQAATTGGGVYSIDGKVDLSGGTIGGTGANDANTAENGGGVYIAGGKLNMPRDSAAVISNNVAQQDGGGIYFAGTSAWDTYGHSIIGNKATAGSGGGVYFNTTGNISYYGGDLSKNTAAENGGGVYVTGGTNFRFFGGTIGGTEATDANTAVNGGGVYIADGSISLSSTSGAGTISYNTASENGGGIYVEDGGISSSDPCVFSYNSAKNGGGVYLANNSTLSLGDGEISYNMATKNGGGVYVTNGSVTMAATSGADSKIAYNSAENGGGVYVEAGRFAMNRGVLSYNTASGYGGGVYAPDGDHSIFNSSATISIENNTSSTENGGDSFYIGGTLSIGGSPQITRASSDDQDIVLADGKIDICQRLGYSAPFNVTLLDPLGNVTTGDFTTGTGWNTYMQSTPEESISTYFVSHDRENYIVIKNTETNQLRIEHLYTVTFNLNEGSPDTANGGSNDQFVDQKVVSSRYAEEPSPDPIKTGYTFNGWYKDYVDSVDPGTEWDFTSTPVTEDIDLTAHWTPITYTVTFNNNKPTNAITPEWTTGSIADQTFTYDKADPTLTTDEFELKGWEFTGWYTKSDYSNDANKLPNLDDAVADANELFGYLDENTGKVTLYAGWEAITYTVTFNASAPTGASSELIDPNTGNENKQTFTYDTAQALSPDPFTLKGYDLMGWYTGQNGTGTKIDGNNVTNTLFNHVDPNSRTVTLYAKWEAIKYRVTFDKNASQAAAGGANGTINGGEKTITYTYDQVGDWPAFNMIGGGTPIYTLAGWTNQGWHSDTSGDVGKTVDSTSGKPANDLYEKVSTLDPDNDRNITLYSYWEPNTYTIHFVKVPPLAKYDEDDVTGTMEEQDLKYEQTDVLNESTYKLYGYDFKEWNTNSEGTGNVVADKAEFSTFQNLLDLNEGNFRLYSQWDAVDFTVRFADGQPENASNTVDGTEYATEEDKKQSLSYDGSENLAASKFDLLGWTQDGWYVADANDTPITDINGELIVFQSGDNVTNALFQLMNPVDGNSQVVTDITLHANWEPNEYTVTFDNNEGSGTMPDQVLRYDHETAADLRQHDFERGGYSFIGWNTEADGSGTAVEAVPTVTTFALRRDASAPLNLTSVNNDNVTLYAQWGPDTYMVQFDPNGGYGEMDLQPFTFDTPQALSANTFKRAMYDFTGWNTEADGSGTSYPGGASYTVDDPDLDNGTPITLYAQWTPKDDDIDRDKDDDGEVDEEWYDPNGDPDGDGVPNAVDPDDDGDGTKDFNDDDHDSDGDGVPDNVDPDDDDPDVREPNDPNGDDSDPDSDGDGVPNENDPDHPDFWDPDDGDDKDEDSDLDGNPDIVDPNPNDPNKDAEPDRDGDGIPDSEDKYDPFGDDDNDGIPNASDDDNDGDGIPDWYDPHVDTDNDGDPNWKDTDDDNDNGKDGDTSDPSDTGEDKDDNDDDGDGIKDGDDPDHPDFWKPENVDPSGDTEDDKNPNKDEGGADTDDVPNAIDKDNDGPNDAGIDATKDDLDEDNDGEEDIQDADDDNDGIPDIFDPDADSDGDGIPDWLDPDKDGDDIPDVVDPDDDNDGVPDWNDPDVDTDGDGVPDKDDDDDDNDGIDDDDDDDDDGDGIPDDKDPDHKDYNGGDSDGDGNNDDDGDKIPDVIDPDTDSDGDGTPDWKEPYDPFGDNDDDGIPNASDDDDDGDGIPDWHDPHVNTDGDDEPNWKDTDDDNDGDLDDVDDDDDGDGIKDKDDPDHPDFWKPENVDPSGDTEDEKNPNKDEGGADTDDVPNAIDKDNDGDGKLDGDGSLNDDGDSEPDLTDTDDDNDGIPDWFDPDADSDNDGIPDIEDPDNDNDGVPDVVDPDDDDDGQKDWEDPDVDTDGDGKPDITDPDDDGDGKLDDKDPDSDGDGIPNDDDPDHPDFWDRTDEGENDPVDTDGDGKPDDKDGDDRPDVVDPDYDGDGNGTPDWKETEYDPAGDPDGDGIPNASDDDDDGDGIPDWHDPHTDTDGDKDPNWNDPNDDKDDLPDDKDPDDDGDGILDVNDPDHPDFYDPTDDDKHGGKDDKNNPDEDPDKDGIPNAIDKDNDNGENANDPSKGTPDDEGNKKPNLPYDKDGDNDGDGIPNKYDPDADSDGDGYPDPFDKDPNDPNVPEEGKGNGNGSGSGGGSTPPLTDTDGDGIPDIYDEDDDNDGIPDYLDPNPLVPDVNDPCAKFEDIDRDSWYHEYIDYVVESGLMIGVSETLFDPNGTTTRAQAVMLMWRLEGSPMVSHPLYFSDIEGGAWYIDALRWTNSENIAIGYDDGRFGTNDPVTREQIATLLWRYARYSGIDTSSGEGVSLLKFSDAKKISAYAISALQWACSEELIVGTVDEHGSIILDPQGSATRAQIAAILMRFCEGVLK